MFLYEKIRNKLSRTHCVILLVLVIAILAGVSGYVYWTVFEYRFTTIDKGKVYRSGAMSLEALGKKVQKHNIRTVIDFRKDKFRKSIDAEHSFLEKKGVKHLDLPSDQVPTKETIGKFLDIMNDKNNYPVLMHCNHGTGRAVLFSAVYRIEYQKMTNEQARKTCRWILKGSSFSSQSSKGRFLIDYQRRRNADNEK